MIKKLALTIFMLTCVLFASISAQTQTSPEKQAAVKELVQLVNGDNKAEEILNVMTAQMQTIQDETVKAILDERTDLSAADRKACEEIIANERKLSFNRFHEKLMRKINFNEMINEIAATLYDKYFTLEEIKDLNAFYRTATGQKALKTMAPLAADTMQIMQGQLMPKLMIVIKEITDEDKTEIVQKINAAKPRAKKNAGK